MADRLVQAIVTTGRKVKADSIALAKATAQRLGIPFAPRRNESIEELRDQYGTPFVLVAKKGLLFLDTREGEFFFHPNMAHLRLKNLRFGDGKDHMVEAMGLKEGMSVLDCTLGFGTDAIVASFAAGEKGHVTGLEASPLIAEVTGYGLAHFHAENYPIQEAMRRIQTVPTDYLDFLRQAEDDSYDIVYFDPMFRHPLMESRNLNPLRLAADHSPVSEEAVLEARRVARYRVVFKENARSMEFERLGFSAMAGGKYSKVCYGIISLPHHGEGEPPKAVDGVL